MTPAVRPRRPQTAAWAPRYSVGTALGDGEGRARPGPGRPLVSQAIVTHHETPRLESRY
jgi:hypothetical protein